MGMHADLRFDPAPIQLSDGFMNCSNCSAHPAPLFGRVARFFRAMHKPPGLTRPKAALRNQLCSLKLYVFIPDF